ncbi:MAG: type IV secretory system conjugative DNA transfer family protein [Candidatus Levyibacteriota bacterium]
MINLHTLEAGTILSKVLGYIEYHNVSSYFIILNYIAALLIVFVLIFLIRKLLCIKRLLQQKSIFLELTPPAKTEKTAYTTQQLFSVLHNVGSQRTFIEKMMGEKALFSFEIVSTREQGIRYIIKATPDKATTIESTIVSYLPFVRVKQVGDYFTEKHRDKKTKIIEFKLKRHFAFPLAKQNVLNQHDPVAYITGMMTKLQPGELISFQIVVSPTKVRETDTLTQKILNNEDVIHHLGKIRIPWYVQPFMLLFKVLIKCVQIISHESIWIVHELAHGSNKYASQNDEIQQRLRVSNTRPARVLSAFEEEVVTSVHEKIQQALFETSIRAIIVQESKSDLNQRIRSVTSSLAPFSVPKYQSLASMHNFPPFFIDKMRMFIFRNRLLSLFDNKSSSLLAVSEIADLYHFPYNETTKTENIVKSHSKELPAPLSLKNNPDLDVVFAKNIFGGRTTMIGLTKDERRRHMYTIGATGTGKSTLISYMINQDIMNNKGLSVVDPHGELAESMLASIPESRKNDLIYFNPDDLKYPIGINLMELTPGLDEEDSLREKEFIAESVISLFRKVFSTAMSGSPHRIEYILRNTIHTAFTVENPTLFTIFDLLNNPVFQQKVVSQLKDENLKNFWKFEFGKAGDFQRVKMVSPVTARIGRFLFSPSAKRILEQPKSTINFDEILDGKILICNLAKGKLGEDTSQVLGIMILNKIQLAALKRARIPSAKRKDFYLYVDEFQNFATKSFVDMLSESRKYKLNLIIAEQSTSQQTDRNLVHIILANVGTVVTFRSANPEDEMLMLPQFAPYINPGEIYNLPAYHFYIKISALHPEEPFSGETILLTPNTDPKKITTLIQTSRRNYANEYKKPVEQEEKIAVKKEKKTAKDSGNSDERKPGTNASGALPEVKKGK